MSAAKPRSRVWWLWRMIRAYRKHRCLRSRGLRRTWEDAMLARRMMPPAEQWSLRPIRGTTSRLEVYDRG